MASCDHAPGAEYAACRPCPTMDKRGALPHRRRMTEAKERIGVVGAGLMGAEIALVHALAGHEVVLSDRSEELLHAARARLKDILDKGVARGFYEAQAPDAALARIATSVDLAPFAQCDMVIEAIFENEAAKAELWQRLDRICGAAAIFASNTSSIAISTLASYVAAERRPLFLGTHYFSPVSRMKLVEIIPAFDTAPATVETAIRIARGAGKTPIRVKDVVGFAVNRVLTAFLIEAVRLVEEGVASPEDVDLACRLGLGHPMGPFELMDAVSSNLALEVQEILFNAYGERFRPPALMKQMVKAGRIGRKSGKGWRTR
jgi:3-hydroxybutyryl-CoA dehydrogenase